MKRLNLLLIAVMLVGGMAFAQGKPGKKQTKVTPVERAEKMTERMAKELSLNEQQRSQVNTINLAFLKEMQECKKDKKALEGVCDSKNSARLSKESRADLKKVHRNESKKMKGYMKAARNSRDLKLKEVLTKEQYALYQKNKEEQKAKKESNK